jgi:hypothetical protein
VVSVAGSACVTGRSNAVAGGRVAHAASSIADTMSANARINIGPGA